MNIRITLLFLTITFLSKVNAQTVNGTTTPNPATKLDLNTTEKAF